MNKPCAPLRWCWAGTRVGGGGGVDAYVVSLYTLSICAGSGGTSTTLSRIRSIYVCVRLPLSQLIPCAKRLGALPLPTDACRFLHPPPPPRENRLRWRPLSPRGAKEPRVGDEDLPSLIFLQDEVDIQQRSSLFWTGYRATLTRQGNILPALPNFIRRPCFFE